ncbi:5,6-dimethylbenzimidazole synthase [Kytococcus schroeteri]|uniref:5,6-dimethylbenzimidazole synthase n=3 Tax=Kytococcus TaxID=57499 RepID=A0A2I1PA06_9MICO|nr:5,6-dimethylbenzimidazole synthase [Kytococcus schroeteri]PKZ41467.1 5,6-dimethylbenzimidazole synthase [Kytococcus schroeteri]
MEPPRPTPRIGDPSSAAQRAADPSGWSMGEQVRAALEDVLGARRDIRRFRPDPVPEELVREVLAAGHAAPSVGHSQPWRFVVVRDPATRDRAAHLADAARVAQADLLVPERAARLLDLKLEGLREAPVGVVVACDRRTPAAGVLGRATFPDTDLWSCACAIQNMWLTARALGLGMGWVTLFEPADLAGLLHLPEGVETLGWLCLGWPDERPPEPGLQRAAWSRKAPLEDVVLSERWPQEGDAAPDAPVSHLRGPAADRLVGSTDAADRLLAPPEALGVLDRVASRVAALAGPGIAGGTLVLAGADHPVTAHDVSAYATRVTYDVLTAAVAGGSLGAAHARAAGLEVLVVDAGCATEVRGATAARPRGPQGDLVSADALTEADVDALLEAGRVLGRDAALSGGPAGPGLVVLGEVGVGNTTVAAALAGALLGLEPAEAGELVGLGAGSDDAMVARKRAVVAAALERTGASPGDAAGARRALAAVGGPEVAVLTGVALGAVEAGAPVVLDGLATCVAALAATRIEPAVQAHLVAGQRSREVAHPRVLRALGLEPLLSLRLRAGEGVGACLAAGMVLATLSARRETVRTAEDAPGQDALREDTAGE